MLIVGGLVAVGLSVFVSRSVAGPLRDVETAMSAVEQGDLRVRCAVVGNDEIGAVAEGFNRMVGGLRERELVRETFGKYVTESARRDPRRSSRLEGQPREVTILFADIRDFTPWVEAHDPREVVRDLNAYFTQMEGAIRDHRGLVLQYIGDEIEAVFGAPVAGPRHADMAVPAALEMRRRLRPGTPARGADRRAAQRNRGPFRARARRQHRQSRPPLRALVGDPVNVASRLQGLNKELRGHPGERHHPGEDRRRPAATPAAGRTGEGTRGRGRGLRARLSARSRRTDHPDCVQGATYTIQDTPKRSATIPKRGEKKVRQRHLHLPAVAERAEQPLGLGLARHGE